MNGAESTGNLAHMPYAGPSRLVDQRPFSAKSRRLLGVRDVAEWLRGSKGGVRDHAAGRRQPLLRSIKLGPSKGTGLWKFREQDVDEVGEAQCTKRARPPQ